jgi:exonuclease III
LEAPKSSAQLTCLYTNADSLLNKRNELSLLIQIHSPDIICITETAPKNAQEELQPSEIQVQGYSLHTNNKQPQRGVAIYVSEKLDASPLELEAIHTFKEHCWVSVKLCGNDRLLIGCIYSTLNS